MALLDGTGDSIAAGGDTAGWNQFCAVTAAAYTRDGKGTAWDETDMSRLCKVFRRFLGVA